MIQAIWSRTAQTRSCRCRSCFHAATTVARRATTAASRRRLKVSDLFTACYSTILATAAVADARVKDDRSREWDRVIAEAKADLRQGVDGGSMGDAKISEADAMKPELKKYSPFMVTEPHEAPHEDTDVYETGVYTNTSGVGVGGFMEEEDTFYSPSSIMSNEGVSAAHNKFAIKLKALDHKIRVSRRCDLTEDVDNEQATASEWVDEDPDSVMYERDPLSPTHLERRELSCATLIEQLLTRLVGSIQFRVKNSPDLKAHPELQDTVMQIQQLRQRRDKLPSYKWEDVEVIGAERRALHRSLIGICNAAAPDDIPSLELMVAKICYKLLVFSSPVSMVTYNVLVESLGQLKQYDLAQVFVDSFLYDTRLKPNHNSISILLEHYHQKNDMEGWRGIKDRMRATSVGFDMRIKRRWLGEIGRISIQNWIRRTSPNDLKKQKGRGPWDQEVYVSQKAPRDCNAFDALIRGSLSFSGPRNAILHIKRALRDYQDIYSETICAVMEELLRQRDARGSTSLINCVLTLWEEGSDPDAITFTGAVRQLIYQLLDMIGVDTTIGSQLTPPNYLSLEAVQALLRQMHMMSVFETLGRSAAFIDTIDSHLQKLLRSRLETPAPNLYITSLDSSKRPQYREELQDDENSEISNTNMAETNRDFSPETIEVESDDREPLPLEWFAAVEEARANDLAYNKASGRWARIESMEKQVSFYAQRVKGVQNQALPFLLAAMPRYQQLRYLDITSSSMVYHRKEDRPRQYDELVRVCDEGVMGVLNFVARQLDFQAYKSSKTEAEIFTNTPVHKLSPEDLEYFTARAANHIAVNEPKITALQVEYANLMHESQSLQNEIEEKTLAGNSDGSALSTDHLDIIAKRMWKLEVDFKAANIHQSNLLYMQETLASEGYTRLVFELGKSVHRVARSIYELENNACQITGYTVPYSMHRVTREANEIFAVVRALCDEVITQSQTIRQQRNVRKKEAKEEATALLVAKWKIKRDEKIAADAAAEERLERRNAREKEGKALQLAKWKIKKAARIAAEAKLKQKKKRGRYQFSALKVRPKTSQDTRDEGVENAKSTAETSSVMLRPTLQNEQGKSTRTAKRYAKKRVAHRRQAAEFAKLTTKVDASSVVWSPDLRNVQWEDERFARRLARNQEKKEKRAARAKAARIAKHTAKVDASLVIRIPNLQDEREAELVPQLLLPMTPRITSWVRPLVRQVPGSSCPRKKWRTTRGFQISVAKDSASLVVQSPNSQNEQGESKRAVKRPSKRARAARREAYEIAKLATKAVGSLVVRIPSLQIERGTELVPQLSLPAPTVLAVAVPTVAVASAA